MNADAVMKDRLEEEMLTIGRAAKAAAAQLAFASAKQKNQALLAAATALRDSVEDILAANAKDLEVGRAKGLSAPLLDRLALTPERIEAMAAGLEAVVAQPDPVGRVLDEWDRPNGFQSGRHRFDTLRRQG